MAVTPTTPVEIDSDLLARLRQRHPGKDDRTLIEDLARVDLGFEAMRRAQQRHGLDENEASALAAAAVRESRRSRG